MIKYLRDQDLEVEVETDASNDSGNESSGNSNQTNSGKPSKVEIFLIDFERNARQVGVENVRLMNFMMPLLAPNIGVVNEADINKEDDDLRKELNA